jgi:hypothetical protein
MSDAEALKSLGAFPLVQAAVALLVILAGIWLVVRGNRDKKTGDSGSTIPQWLMMGPAHDAIGAIHDMAEQSRVTNHILERGEALLNEIAKEQRETTQMLELIRNESRLR